MKKRIIEVACLTESADGAAGQTGRTVPECLRTVPVSELFHFVGYLFKDIKKQELSVENEDLFVNLRQIYDYKV